MAETKTATKTATLGGGCFWCLEAVFQRVDGVEEVVSGYSGGHVENPSYRQVCAGETGHAEVVQVRFDPSRVTFRELLKLFFEVHDPTTPDRQGADVGPQYRSIILWHDEVQEQEAEEAMAELERRQAFDAPLVTELAPFERFYPAEAEHHRFYERNPGQAYCRLVIRPKVERAEELLSEPSEPGARAESGGAP